jgi:hypothetical protein
MTLTEDQEKMRRGKEVDERIRSAWKEPNESVNLLLRLAVYLTSMTLPSSFRRAAAIQTLAAIESQSLQTKGRHSGWAKIQDCVIACRAISPNTEYFSFTETEAHTIIERCLELGLVEAKHCDDADGLVQQFLKFSSDFADYQDYRRQCLAQKVPLVNPAGGWWIKDCKGNYPPPGPSSEAAKKFAPVLERFHQGLQLATRLDQSGTVDTPRL